MNVLDYAGFTDRLSESPAISTTTPPTNLNSYQKTQKVLIVNRFQQLLRWKYALALKMLAHHHNDIRNKSSRRTKNNVHLVTLISILKLGPRLGKLPCFNYGSQNGIVAFIEPWKNVVATFYHEMNEDRNDPDVEEANSTGNDRLVGWISAKGGVIGDFPVFEDKLLTNVFK